MSHGPFPSMNSVTFQQGAANLPPSMSGPGSTTSNTNPFQVHGHMTGPLTSSQMSQRSPSVNPEEKYPEFIPSQHGTSHPMGSAHDAPPLQSHPTGSFSPPGSPPSGPQQQSLPFNGQMTAMQPYRPVSFMPQTPIDGGHQGGQTFIPGSQPEYPPSPGSLPPAHFQGTPTGTSTFNGGRQSFSHIPNGPPGSPPHYNPQQQNHYGYNNNSWTGTTQQNNNFYGNQERGAEFGQFGQPQPKTQSELQPQSWPQPQSNPGAQSIVVMAQGPGSAQAPQHPSQTCPPGCHSFKTKYGVAGILIAIIFFPCGLFALCIDSEQMCTRCGQRV